METTEKPILTSRQIFENKIEEITKSSDTKAELVTNLYNFCKHAFEFSKASVTDDSRFVYETFEEYLETL
jgi:hypothetical protein